jgi:hypothetical protein
MYEAVNRLKNAAQHVRRLDGEIVAEIVFLALRLAALVPDPKRALLLETACHCAGYLVTRGIRPGADMNRALDSPGRNPDVLLYLHLRLARDLGIEVPDEGVLIRFIWKRMGTVRDYLFPAPTETSRRIARIGAHLVRYVAELGSSEPVGVGDSPSS